MNVPCENVLDRLPFLDLLQGGADVACLGVVQRVQVEQPADLAGVLHWAQECVVRVEGEIQAVPAGRHGGQPASRGQGSGLGLDLAIKHVL